MTIDAHLGKLLSLTNLCIACKRKNLPPETMDDIIKTIADVSNSLAIAYRRSY